MPSILKAATFALVTSLLTTSPCRAEGPQVQAKPDQLSAMFTWWNQGMKTPGGFTEAGFSKYFTADAPLVIDGIEVMRAPAGWAKRFQGIQALTDAVEIVVPFRYSFQQGDRIYTYHIIRSRAAGKVSCMLAAGHADHPRWPHQQRHPGAGGDRSRIRS